MVAVTEILLRHHDEHHESALPSSALRAGRHGDLLNVWLDDACCSPSCIASGGVVEAIAPAEAVGDGFVRVAVSERDGNGLRLHWAMLVPSGRPHPRRHPAPPGPGLPAQRRESSPAAREATAS